MEYTNKFQSKNYFLGFLQLILGLAILSSAANAATYVVTNTTNSGLGSLRQAILNANANPGADFITFNIPGSGVHLINIGINYLPPITGTVTIDGGTQSGYSTHPVIGIYSTGGGSGFSIQGGVATIKAINIFNFYAGISVDCDFHSTTCESNRPGLILKGSRIGTNYDGSSFDPFDNQHIGVLINGANAGSTQIGGTGVNDINVISNSNFEGIRYVNNPCENCTPNNDPGRSHLVIGNRIGTNYLVTAAIPNGWSGISVNTKKVKIGGDTPVESNFISGNKEHGIVVYADNTVIEGNYIGICAVLNQALPNLLNGITVAGADNVRIGGTAAGTGNLISGNGENGIAIVHHVVSCGSCYDTSEPAKNNLIYGNRIGLNAAGTGTIPNKKNGVSINAESTVVGESETGGAANIISGNLLNGVFIYESEHHPNFTYPEYALFLESKDNRIQRNYIGTNETGDDFGNKKNGVLIDGDVSNTIIGGNDPARKNLISFNDENGVSLINTFDNGNNAAPINNQITLNDISSNGLKGISIYTNALQANDPYDTDEGINNLQNHPILTGAFPGSITGYINTVPNKGFTVNFYSSPACDASGKGEGKTNIGSISITTDAYGNANFATNFGAPAGSIVTATATNSIRAWETGRGNTSEFSACTTTQPADPGSLSLDSAAYSANENSNSVTITVKRTGGTLGGVTVDYSAKAGTATAGADFAPQSGTLTFAAGQMSKTFAIPIAEDNTDEAPETVNIEISNPSVGAVMVSPSSAVLTINDNDAPPTLSIADVILAEGNQNTTDFNFLVTKNGASEQTVTVNYKTVGITATNGVDYSNTTGTLTLAPGETSKAITVPVFGELTVETNETFKIALSAPVNASLNNTEALGTILDDDNPGKLQFSQPIYTVNENAGSQIVTVLRTGGTTGTVTVDYATTGSGTASAAGDFTPASGTLLFLDGETTKTFTVTVQDDQTNEQTETINLILSNSTGGATIQSNAAVINILDDDAPASASINGTVYYAVTPFNQSQKTVPGAVVSVSGASSASDTTDFSGNYSIENLTPGGQYTVSAVKAGGQIGITAFDATLILRHVAANGQGSNALSANQQKAADADADNSVSAFDATQILRFVAANGANANTGQTGNWKFLPATRSYQSLSSSFSGENFEAVLIGEVSGDWMPPAGSEAEMDKENEILSAVEENGNQKNDELNAEAEISFPIELSQTSADEILVVPVMLTNYAGRAISAYSFDVHFDPNVLQLDSEMPIETSETLSRGKMIAHNVSKSGRIGIAAAGGSENGTAGGAARGGILLKLRFNVTGTAAQKSGGLTDLAFRQNAVFEDGDGGLLKVKRTNSSIRLFAGGLIQTKNH